MRPLPLRTQGANPSRAGKSPTARTRGGDGSVRPKTPPQNWSADSLGLGMRGAGGRLIHWSGGDDGRSSVDELLRTAHSGLRRFRLPRPRPAATSRVRFSTGVRPSAFGARFAHPRAAERTPARGYGRRPILAPVLRIAGEAPDEVFPTSAVSIVGLALVDALTFGVVHGFKYAHCPSPFVRGE